MDIYRAHVLCCGGTGCSSSGSAQLIERFEEKIKENGLDKEVKVIRTGCFGLCEAGPVVIVYPEGTFYSRVKVEDVDEIVNTVALLAGSFGGINLEDIAAPRCFEIERKLALKISTLGFWLLLFHNLFLRFRAIIKLEN